MRRLRRSINYNMPTTAEGLSRGALDIGRFRAAFARFDFLPDKSPRIALKKEVHRFRKFFVEGVDDAFLDQSAVLP